MTSGSGSLADRDIARTYTHVGLWGTRYWHSGPTSKTLLVSRAGRLALHKRRCGRLYLSHTIVRSAFSRCWVPTCLWPIVRLSPWASARAL